MSCLRLSPSCSRQPLVVPQGPLENCPTFRREAECRTENGIFDRSSLEDNDGWYAFYEFALLPRFGDGNGRLESVVPQQSPTVSG
jgi:hypothetical protein